MHTFAKITSLTTNYILENSSLIVLTEYNIYYKPLNITLNVIRNIIELYM